MGHIRSCSAARTLGDLTHSPHSGRFVYFLINEASGWCKIGQSRDPLRRIAALCGRLGADTLCLEKVIDGSQILESALHRVLSSHRVPPEAVARSRECYWITTELRSWIDARPDANCETCLQFFPRKNLFSSEARRRLDPPRTYGPAHAYTCASCSQKVPLPYGRQVGRSLWRRLKKGEAARLKDDGWEISYEPFWADWSAEAS